MFDKYKDKILALENFNKKDILSEKFELYNKNNMQIYYAPHNEIINEKAKIFIVGITPGWTQTCIAYKTANETLKKGYAPNEVKKLCKKNSRFAGSMRKNLIEMLDELNLNNKLNLESCANLFDVNEELLHTTSIIPYPVFINGKNYTGSNPSILKNKILLEYTKQYFYKEVRCLSNTLIIPLGKSVEEVLLMMIHEGLIKEDQCLFGFPHPSGANGHRKKQFAENKKILLKIIENYFE